MTRLMKDTPYDARKRLWANTWWFTQGKTERIRLHDTDIAVLRRGRLSLYTGGWATPLTRDRLNKILDKYGVPWQIYQHKRRWWVSRLGQYPWMSGNRQSEILFHEGITFLVKAGKLAAPERCRKVTDRELRRKKILDERIEGYCDGLKAWLKKHPDESRFPNHGDCWACYFQACEHYREENPEARQAIARRKAKEYFFGDGHLRRHLDEEYYHGSLIYNAMAWAGRDDPLLFLAYADSMASIIRDVRRYLRTQLGEVA